MGNLVHYFRKAVARANDERGKPALLGKADGTLYWVDLNGLTHRTRVWARIGEQASNQEVVVDCLRASPQVDMPVRIDHVNGRLTVIAVDSQRSVEFTGGRGGGDVPAHAWLHNRLGPDPVYVSGLQYLPLLVTPNSTPNLTVNVQGGAYRWGSALQIFETAVSGSLSSYVPSSGKHFVIICLDRPNDQIVIVDGDDIAATDALFGTVAVTAADIEAVSINSNYLPLAAVLLYAGQTAIRARDIVMDLRPSAQDSGGGGTPGGSDTQLQYNDGGAFGGIADFVYDDASGQIVVGATSAETSDKLEIHPTAAQDARNSYVNEQAVSAANTLGHDYYLKDDNGNYVKYGSIAIGSTTTFPTGEYGVFEVKLMRSGVLTSILYLDATSELIFNDGADNLDLVVRGDSLNYLFNIDAGLGAVRVGDNTTGTIADFQASAIVFNESGSDQDFRVEGDTDADLFFVDAGNDRVGFGTNTPGALVDVAGELRTSSGSDYVSIQTTGGLGSFRSIVASGNATLDFDPDPADNSGNALFRFFRNANTTGAVRVQIFKGNNTGTQVHILDAKGTTVFNEQGDDIDFRVEGDSDSNLFFADASRDNIGIGTGSPATSAKLEISSTTGALLLSRMTTTQRNALTAVNGMVIYNTTNNRIEAYENGSWADL